ncbi:MAG TPA: hypothetical protein VJZ71_01480 [Phycisphaerae bacterium]|nr:hypothetical protein [Phycisphaerae bacterium]
MPDDVAWQKIDSVWRVKHEPKQSTVQGMDGINLRVNDAGLVTAKYYWCRQEEFVWLPLWFIRREKDLWELDLDRTSIATTSPNESRASDEFDAIAAECRELYVTDSVWHSNQGQIPPEEIVRVLREQHKVIDKNLRYEQVRESRIFPALEKTIWRLHSPDGKCVRISAESDVDISIVIWAGAGYVYMATHGGKVP